LPGTISEYSRKIFLVNNCICDQTNKSFLFIAAISIERMKTDIPLAHALLAEKKLEELPNAKG